MTRAFLWYMRSQDSPAGPLTAHICSPSSKAGGMGCIQGPEHHLPLLCSIRQGLLSRWPASVQVKQRDNFPLRLGVRARLQQEVAVMKCETDDLLHAAHNILVAHPVGYAHTLQQGLKQSHCKLQQSAGHKRAGRGPASLQQWQVIVFRHLDDLCDLTQRAEAEGLGSETEVSKQEPSEGRCRACSSSSRLSGGWRRRLCGSTTVNRCGFSARSAPLMTAALVPVAPEV